MLKKVAALTAVLLLTTIGVAQAQTYPPQGNSITADDTTVAPGESIVLGIQICRAAATATFDLDSTTNLGSTIANSSGVASLTTTIPSNTSPGTHTIEGECVDPNGAPLVQVLSITVTGAAIPVTGSSSTVPMTQIAIAAIVVGGLLVLAASKRRSNANASDTVGV